MRRWFGLVAVATVVVSALVGVVAADHVTDDDYAAAPAIE
jgi:hypothetical protein